MSNITGFGGTTNVPAFVRNAAPGNLAAVRTSDGAFPYISLKGKVFTKRDGETKTLITKPDTDEPANALEVVILDVGPSTDKKINCKVWYANGYEEGSTAKPDCYSNDGIAPAADAKEAQSSKCALCPKNVWGSGHNGQGTECSSSKRLAIATPDNLDEPMLLRVPAGSLTGLGEYFKWMKTSGIQDSSFVVTKIGFDYTVAHQKLTFKGLGWAQNDPTAAKGTDLVAMIVGKKELPKDPEAAEPFEQARPAFAEKAAEEPKKAAPAPVVAEEDDLPTTPKVKTEVKVEQTKKAAPKPEPVVATDADMDAAIDDLDFDD